MSTKTLVILHMLFLIPYMSYVQLYAFFFESPDTRKLRATITNTWS
jgi:hypothetical protein